MTEDQAREVFSRELPNRVIAHIEKTRKGYLLNAYDREVGPTDVSGTAFLVKKDGRIRKLSISEYVKLIK